MAPKNRRTLVGTGTGRSRLRRAVGEGARAGRGASEVCPGLGIGARRAAERGRPLAAGTSLPAVSSFLRWVRREAAGGERWRPRSAHSGADVGSSASSLWQALSEGKPGASLGGVRPGPGSGKFMLLASTFRAGATAPSEEEPPLRQALRPVGALLAPFFGGRQQPFQDPGGNCLCRAQLPNLNLPKAPHLLSLPVPIPACQCLERGLNFPLSTVQVPPPRGLCTLLVGAPPLPLPRYLIVGETLKAVGGFVPLAAQNLPSPDYLRSAEMTEVMMNTQPMEEIGLSPRKDGLSYQIFPDPSDFDRCCKLKDRLPSIVVEPTEGEVESGELRWPPEEFLVQEDEQDNCEETAKENKEQ
ncbi:PREDICTED: protein LBH isoform X1 [Rhinopithecus bieti]|nr:PREDICTED: protein LBH isoform X1 [Rhinopithecus bieti]